MRSRNCIGRLNAVLGLILVAGIIALSLLIAHGRWSGRMQERVLQIQGIFPDPDQINVIGTTGECTLSAEEDGYDQILYLNEQRMQGVVFYERMEGIADAVFGGPYVEYVYDTAVCMDFDFRYRLETGNVQQETAMYQVRRLRFYTDPSRQGCFAIIEDHTELAVFAGFIGDAQEMRDYTAKLLAEQEG